MGGGGQTDQGYHLVCDLDPVLQDIPAGGCGWATVPLTFLVFT